MIISIMLLLSFKIDCTSSRRVLNMNKNEFIDNNSHYMKFIVFHFNSEVWKMMDSVIVMI